MNVHPTKTEIRIEKELDVRKDIQRAIEELLEKNNLVTKIEHKQIQQTQLKKKELLICLMSCY